MAVIREPKEPDTMDEILEQAIMDKIRYSNSPKYKSALKKAAREIMGGAKVSKAKKKPSAKRSARGGSYPRDPFKGL